jgi:TfoX/Sxy family transcriptional regulator of competence genes
MTHQTPLIDRIRATLSDRPATREVAMFGGRCFMVNDKMVVAVLKDGDLLVRADPERNGELLSRPGAQPAEMGGGRTMGPSWISVAGDAVATDGELTFWTDVALAYNAQVVQGAR